jgi:hypothetical protein
VFFLLFFFFNAAVLEGRAYVAPAQYRILGDLPALLVEEDLLFCLLF